MIPKKYLISGRYYLGRTNQRSMPLGIWDGEKNKFICIKKPEFGMYSIYEMNHAEDDNGFVLFEPIEEIITNDKKGNKVP